MTPELRPYQAQAIDAVRASMFQRRHHSTLLVSPTGSGKTVMFCYLTGQLVARGKRVAILNHREELTEQISKSLHNAAVPHGIIAAGMDYQRAPQAHVASVFTLARRLAKVEVPDYVIVDEAHHAISGSTWGKVIDHWREANPALRLIGVTATPERLDGAGLGSMFEDMVLGPQVAELIAGGHLADYRLFAPPQAQQINADDMKHQAGDFAKADASAASMKPAIMGSVMGHYRKHLDGAPSVAFCASVEAAVSFAEKFRSEGYRAASIDGKMDKKDRREITRDFAAGLLNVLTSCDLVSEGYDVPGIVGAILLRPTESLALCLQQIGRALRPKVGGGKAIILDHVGNTGRHGLPDDEREWTLDAVSRSKRKAKDADDVAIRQCKACFAISRATAPKCRECGKPFIVAARTIEEKEGELFEVDGAAFRMSRNEVNQAAATERYGASLDALAKLGQMRGMKNPEGWAKHVLDAREAKAAKRRASA